LPRRCEHARRCLHAERSVRRGQEDLFNDLFGGGPDWFVYEVMPARSLKAGITGRGLEGIADAFLKAFGI
jgi:hypothetical protein